MQRHTRRGSVDLCDGATSRLSRPIPRRSVPAALLLLMLCALTGCGNRYPDDWPGAGSMFATRKGWSCPDLEGDYSGVSSQLQVMFGVGSERDRWRDHHARITQADDGSWLRLNLGLTAKGTRAARGEQGVTRHRSAASGAASR